MADSNKSLVALDRLAMMALVVSFVLEALMGLGSVLLGKPMSGYMLMGHVALGVVFAVSLVVVVLSRAAVYRLDGGSCCATTCIGVRTSFWLFVLGGLCLIITPSLAMLPLLGTPGQIYIIEIHLIAALFSICCGAAFALLSKGRTAVYAT